MNQTSSFKAPMIKLMFDFRLISKDNEKIFNRQGRPFLSKKFKDWEKKVKNDVKQIYRGKVLEEDLKMNINAFFTNKVHADTQNLSKGLCDALQKIVYKNDKQIKLITIRVTEGSSHDFFSVDIEPIKQR